MDRGAAASSPQGGGLLGPQLGWMLGEELGCLVRLVACPSGRDPHAPLVLRGALHVQGGGEGQPASRWSSVSPASPAPDSRGSDSPSSLPSLLPRDKSLYLT